MGHQLAHAADLVAERQRPGAADVDIEAAVGRGDLNVERLSD